MRTREAMTITLEKNEARIQELQEIEKTLQQRIETLSLQLAETQRNLIGVQHRIAERLLLSEEFGKEDPPSQEDS